MLKVYREIKKDEMFFVGGDCSAGLKDFSVCQFLSRKYLDVPIVYSTKKIASEMTNELFPVFEKLAQVTGYKPLIAYERNNGGMFEMERLASLNRRGKYVLYKMFSGGVERPEETVRLGWDTNSATRPKMLIDLKECIDKRLIRIYDGGTVNELFSFIIVQSSGSVRAQAERKAHDDHVMSLAIAWQLYISAKGSSEYLLTQDYPAQIQFTSRGRFRK